VNFPGVALVIGNAEKKEFLDLLQDVADTPVVKVSDIRRERERRVSGSVALCRAQSRLCADPERL
jgi:hypothetical protein